MATAGSAITVKVLSRTETSSAIVAYMGIYMVQISLVPALFVWRTPTLEQWPWIILMGAVTTLGQWGMTQAYSSTDAIIVLPFDYARLPMVTVIAFIVFAETPDALTYLGGIIIAGATIYIARRESGLPRSRKLAAETPKSENM